MGGLVGAPKAVEGGGFWVIRGQIRHELSR